MTPTFEFVIVQGVKHSTRAIETTDGLALHVEIWQPEDVRFAVCIAHGQGGHIGRYAAIAERWARVGALVFGLDHRGQGWSGGPAGHVDRFETYVSDLELVLSSVVAEELANASSKPLPVFVWGHSMGGLIALLAVSRRPDDAVPLAGVVVSNPLLGVKMKVPVAKVVAGRWAARIWPTFALPTGITPDMVARDPDVLERYATDPRQVRVASAGWFVGMERAIERAKREAVGISIPTLWCIGTGDRLVDPTVAKPLFEQLSPDTDRTYRVFEDGCHELHHDLLERREAFLSTVEAWMLDHIPKA